MLYCLMRLNIHWIGMFYGQENFILDIKTKLREKEVPHDLAEAEDMLKKHMDLKEEIAANRERWLCIIV